MSHVYALLAVITRNVRIARRRPDLIVQTIAVPIVVLGLASIIFGASDAWPTALTDKDNSPASRQAAAALQDTQGSRGPYYEVITTHEDEASDLVESGRAQLAVEIPRGFTNNATLFAAIVIPAVIAAAGIGVLLAQILRTHRTIQPTVILLALGTYFAAGGFIPVPGLPPAARAFSAAWPPSYVFEWANSQVHNFASPPDAPQMMMLLLAALAGTALAVLAGTREGRRPSKAGQ